MSFNSSSNSSLDHLLIDCFESRTTILIFTTMLITNILLLLPLLLFILYLVLQRWRKQSSSSATPVMSHSDFFTYNMAALELIGIFGSCLYCFGDYIYGQSLQWMGKSIFYLTVPAQTLFHLSTCVERYLAVVHPITYLDLRQAGGVRIRNIITCCIWLLSFGLQGLSNIHENMSLTIICFSLMIFSLITVSFCSFSVLHVLNHPGPGEVSRDRKRVDQSKQRAFHTIVAIMIALLLRLVGLLVCYAMFSSSTLTHIKCALGSSANWLTLPSNLVLPLLFLQRAGKLPSCKHNAKSG